MRSVVFIQTVLSYLRDHDHDDDDDDDDDDGDDDDDHDICFDLATLLGRL